MEKRWRRAPKAEHRRPNPDLAFQDQGSTSICFGCGPENEQGLQIKSHWDGDDAIATWTASASHCGGARNVVNGGVIATLMDCHGLNLAIASAYKAENRPIGSAPRVFFVTANMNINYRRPTSLGKPLDLRASFTKQEGRKTFVHCTVSCENELCAEADILAIRIHRDEAVEPTR